MVSVPLYWTSLIDYEGCKGYQIDGVSQYEGERTWEKCKGCVLVFGLNRNPDHCPDIMVEDQGKISLD